MEGAGDNPQELTPTATQERRAAVLLLRVYDELRHLAARQLAHERPGQTLQPTALVNEAWLRLQNPNGKPCANQQEFFTAAAGAMRRILVDNARRKNRLKHGGGMVRVQFEEAALASAMPSEDLLALDEGLTELASLEPKAAEVIQLRFFAGLTDEEAAQVVGISRRTADRLWTFGRAWLARAIRQDRQ